MQLFLLHYFQKSVTPTLFLVFPSIRFFMCHLSILKVHSLWTFLYSTISRIFSSSSFPFGLLVFYAFRSLKLILVCHCIDPCENALLLLPPGFPDFNLFLLFPSIGVYVSDTFRFPKFILVYHSLHLHASFFFFSTDSLIPTFSWHFLPLSFLYNSRLRIIIFFILSFHRSVVY